MIHLNIRQSSLIDAVWDILHFIRLRDRVLIVTYEDLNLLKRKRHSCVTFEEHSLLSSEFRSLNATLVCRLAGLWTLVHSLRSHRLQGKNLVVLDNI